MTPQPRIPLQVSKTVRLRPFTPDDALPDELTTQLQWYTDPETVRLIDGPGAQPYDLERLIRMLRYLHDHGELYLIERLEQNNWQIVGDATLQPAAIPIVLAPHARNHGIGRAVIATLIQRARALGWNTVQVSDIYDYNDASKRVFEALGFVRGPATDLGHRYSLQL